MSRRNGKLKNKRKFPLITRSIQALVDFTLCQKERSLVLLEIHQDLWPKFIEVKIIQLGRTEKPVTYRMKSHWINQKENERGLRKKFF